MTKKDWTLIACINSALKVLEEHHGWDLSTGEVARLSESFFKDIKRAWPTSRSDLHEIFERAYVACWGKDHQCDKTKPGEIEALMFSLMDYWYDVRPLDENIRLGKSAEETLEAITDEYEHDYMNYLAKIGVVKKPKNNSKSLK